MNTRRSQYVIATLMLFCTPIVLAMMTVHSRGDWPENWPAEMEPFRERAETCHFMAGSEAMIYHIPFENREEFEKLWPVLLSLKSKGAPLHLRTVDLPITDPDDKRVVYSCPQIHITSPVLGRYRKMPDGSYLHTGPWSTDLEARGGILPQFVRKTENEGQWAPLNLGVEEYGFLEQARVELTLYVDGEIIDLNRIKFPEDTPIIDRRRFEEDE